MRDAILFVLLALLAAGCSSPPVSVSDAWARGASDAALATRDTPPDRDAWSATSCAGASDCDDTHWCSLTGCGFTLGTCEPRPTSCAGEWGPTCGCDTHTYDSPCHARLAGATIAAYFIPCISSACAPSCDATTTCVDCGSAGPQCLHAGAPCIR